MIFSIRWYVPPKCQAFSKLYSITTQKTVLYSHCCKNLVTNISDHTNTQLVGENDLRCGDKHCSCGENQGVWRDRTGIEKERLLRVFIGQNQNFCCEGSITVVVTTLLHAASYTDIHNRMWLTSDSLKTSEASQLQLVDHTIIETCT